MTDDISKVVQEMRASSDAIDWKLSEWADRIECDIKKARERESMPREVRQAWEKAWADRLESATTPAEVARFDIGYTEWGAGVMPKAGGTYVRYDDYATLARQLAEARSEAGEIIKYQQRAWAAESQLAEATRRLGEVEGLVGKWRTTPLYVPMCTATVRAREVCADDLAAALTKEPTK